MGINVHELHKVCSVTEHGHCARTLNMYIEHGHWTWTLNMDIEHGHWTWTLNMDIEHGHWTWTLEPEDDSRQHDALRRILLSRVYFLFFNFIFFVFLDEQFLLLTCWLTAAVESKNVISLKVFFTMAEKGLIVFLYSLTNIFTSSCIYCPRMK
jgi:hypothetical protein